MEGEQYILEQRDSLRFHDIPTRDGDYFTMDMVVNLGQVHSFIDILEWVVWSNLTTLPLFWPRWDTVLWPQWIINWLKVQMKWPNWRYHWYDFNVPPLKLNKLFSKISKHFNKSLVLQWKYKTEGWMLTFPLDGYIKHVRTEWRDTWPNWDNEVPK